MKVLSILVLGLFFAMGVTADAAPGDVTDCDRKFLAEVVSAIERKDVAWIVAHSSLPMVLVAEDGRRVIGEEEYATLVRRALTDDFCARFQAEAKKEPFKNWRGVMIGDGILWFEQIGKRGSDTWTYAILAFGGFAFQPSGEIYGEEDLPNKRPEPGKSSPSKPSLPPGVPHP
jgi:hypothetical protein